MIINGRTEQDPWWMGWFWRSHWRSDQAGGATAEETQRLKEQVGHRSGDRTKKKGWTGKMDIMDIMDSDHLRFNWFSTSNDHSSHDQKKFSWFLDFWNWDQNSLVNCKLPGYWKFWKFFPSRLEWLVSGKSSMSTWFRDLIYDLQSQKWMDNHNWKRAIIDSIEPHFHQVSRALCHKLGFGNYIPSIATLQIDAAEKRAAKAEQEYKAMETMETTETAQWFHHVLPCFQRWNDYVGTVSSSSSRVKTCKDRLWDYGSK